MVRSEISHNEGREFYDDGYESDDRSIGNRLDFSNLAFFGREKELERLKAIWKQAGKKSSRKMAPFPLISGFSGTGKSTLVCKLLEDLSNESEQLSSTKTTKSSFFFLRGKYGELQSGDPFSGIVNACSEFASMLLHGDQEHLKRVQDDLQNTVGVEALQVLTSVVPDLRGIFGPNGCRPKLSRVSSDTNGWHRLKYVFQAFFRAISTQKHPTIMFLDDLQWADSASLDLIESLLTDTSLRYFMLVGAIRSNEVDPDHPLHTRMKSIAKIRPVERIEIQNLLQNELSDFVCEVLKLDPEDAQSLIEVLYDKTRGNMFFVKEMLEDLQRKSILFYDMIEFRWNWDLDNLDENVSLSDNVVTVVAGKIKSLPKELQSTLVVAAYTRSVFDSSALENVMRATGHEMESEDLMRLLDMAVHEGILSNSVGSRFFSFSHDRIQQAARSLVETDEGSRQLRRSIGKCLVEMASSDEGEDWMLFVAADNLNATTPVGEDVLFMTQLNLEVAERAFSVAAFVSASAYMKESLNYLDQIANCWSDHYETSLRLFRLMAHVNIKLGNYEVGHKLGQQVLSHSKNDDDKLPTYLTIALAMSRQGKHAEARELHWDALKLSGESRPRIISIPLLFELKKVKRYLHKNSDEDILKLPVMINVKTRMKMDFFADLAVRAYYCAKTKEFVYANVRMLRLGFEFGLSGQMAAACTKFGLILASSGDQKGALRMAKLSRQMFERTGELDAQGQALYIIGNMIEPWSHQLSHTMDTLQMAQKSGMNHGDFEFAFLSSAYIIRQAQMASYHLDAIDAAYTDLEAQMRPYNMQNNITMLNEMRLPVRYLSGRMGLQFDLKQLEGDFGCGASNESSQVKLMIGCCSRLMLGVMFRDHDFALTMTERIEALSFKKQDSSSDRILSRIYFSGLAASGLARRRGRWKFYSLARKYLKELQQITALRGGNLTAHKQLLMEAEVLSLGKGKTATVLHAYVAAIEMSLKTGHIYDAAIGNELAGEYLLSTKDEDLARTHFTEARNLYQQWGSLAKVHHLKTTQSKFLDAPKSGSNTTAKWMIGNVNDLQSKLGIHHRGPPSRTKSTNSAVSSHHEISEHSPV